MIRLNKKLKLLLTLVFLTFQIPVDAQYIVDRGVIGNGGNMVADGKNRITGTMGQALVGETQNKFTSKGGFWQQWQTLPYANAIHVFAADDVVAWRGKTISIPITIRQNVTEFQIISFQFVLAFDADEIEAVGFTTTGAMTENGWSITHNNDVTGQVTVFAFNTMPLAGMGTLINLEFTVLQSATHGQSLPIAFKEFMFNEGSPVVTTHDGSILILNHYTISGKVGYWLGCNDTKPVPRAKMTLTGDVTADTLTNYQGMYELTGKPDAILTLTASKDGDVNGISAFDAAQVSQYGTGTLRFNDCQLIAADVSGDGQVSAYDAALIARYSAGMTSNSLCGTWTILPNSYTYTSIQTDTTGQNFCAILFGEVSGNWQPVAPAFAGKIADSASVTTDILLALDDITGAKTAEVAVPVILNCNVNMEIFAVQFFLAYSRERLTFSRTEASDSINIITNETANGVTMIFYSNLPITTGTLCQLIFKPLAKLQSVETLKLTDALVNDLIPMTKDGTIDLVKIPETYRLAQNIPNPFNPWTTIRYELPEDTFITLKIYDITGRLVITLIDDHREAGYHSITWDGADNAGKSVSSGVYFYRLDTNRNFHAVKRMLLIK